MENQFGRTSKLRWEAVQKDGQTILQDVYFTAPYKIMNPFVHRDGSISVMLLSASAGVMAGDEADFSFSVGAGARIEFLSQSFEKVHKMEEGMAKRRTRISVAENAQFFYHPLPVIPFAQSSFVNETLVELADESSEFEYYEVLACGRSARGERFAYDKFLSKLEIRRGGRLVFRDRTRFLPELFSMEQVGFYEGFTHLGNFLFCNRGKDAQWEAMAKEFLAQESEVQGGVTRLESGDYLVKVLGRQAQKLLEVGQTIGKM